ncbi:hypothetical protein IQ247_19465 [Plectonema cf. radiosum LEGE 06105]|uniref:Uncharacterized protein n=1 Tax=Plectonema cf. radiosum LEGE 06105 TaxID=945769 RepID=A0A8J7K2X2_9CYAN|nr:hypothetical protein [Plectonema radiosum]MBE9214822.1 hypothetical protein [Plectonema cf. radiosum LEGE 06105]
MDLQAQIQLLIDNAPQDGITTQLIAAIAPELIKIAQKLRFRQYYIVQNLEHDWVLTTLSNRTNPQLQKQIIYAYPTLQDVSTTSGVGLDPQMIAAPIGVIEILFQILALEPVDSIIFFNTPGTTANAVEIKRSQVQSIIERSLQQNRRRSDIPPDIA